MALAMFTASVNAEQMVIRQVTPTGQVSYYGFPRPLLIGQRYAVEVHQKDKSKLYFAGAFKGYGMVSGIRHGVPASGIVFDDKKAEGQPINCGNVYLIFIGDHSVLLYKTINNWFTIQS